LKFGEVLKHPSDNGRVLLRGSFLVAWPINHITSWLTKSLESKGKGHRGTGYEEPGAVDV